MCLKNFLFIKLVFLFSLLINQISFAENHDITWKWVKGHAGDPGNERAGELARMGIINQ